MNEEEIKKALEIIKQPILVNAAEYKYFDNENYDKLVCVYDSCLSFINYFEKFEQNAKQLRQENKRLQDNWNKLEDWLESQWKESQDIWYVKIINKLKQIKGE